MACSPSQPDRVNALAEEFINRFRRGERPSVTEYTRKHPELADEIRELFPALVMMEDLGSVAGRPALPHGGNLPEHLGDFRILREIGRGGMGVVYEAVQESLGRHVALKVLPFHALLEPTLLERFRREARAAARLHHTNIVPVFGINEHEGIHYYAMQFIQGQSLNEVIGEVQRLREGKPASVSKPKHTGSSSVARALLSGKFHVASDDQGESGSPERVANRKSQREGEKDFSQLAHPASGPLADSGSDFTTQSEAQYFRSVARLGVQVAEALEYAHCQGIVHRDVKPSNLLLDLRGTVWITDFGLAKAEDSDELTKTGEVVGTVRFMAPERLEGKSDPRSDIYGLGITLYEMLTLQAAFADNNRARLMQRILREEPPRPRKLDPHIPRDLETIVLKAISKAPADRYASAESMAEDLRRFQADRPIQARRSSWAEQAWRWVRRNPGWAAMIGSVAALSLLIAVGLSVGLVQLQTALDGTRTAERLTKQRLYNSLVQQAVATSRSRRPGQRFESLARVVEATRLAREQGWLPDKVLELRNAALAALAMPDLYPGRSWDAPAYEGMPADFDQSFTVYARTDPNGNCSIRRVADDQEMYFLTWPAEQPDQRSVPYPILSDDGRFVTVLYQRGSAQVWQLNGERPRLLFGEKKVWWTFYHPDNRRVAFAHTDGAVSLYDLMTGRRIHLFPRDVSPEAPWRELRLALHPTKPLLAVGSYFASEVQIRDLATEKVVHKLDTPLRCSDLAWHPQGQMLAVSDGDALDVHLYDGASFRPLRTLPGNTGGTRVQFNHAGDRLVASGWGSSLMLYDVGTGQLLFPHPGAGHTVDLRFSADDRWLAARVDRSQLSLWQVADGREYRTLAPVLGNNPTYGVAAVHPEGQLLAVRVSFGGNKVRGIGFWNLHTGEQLAFLTQCELADLCFESEPSGALLTMGMFGSFRWPVRIDLARSEATIGPPVRLPLPPSSGLSRSRDGQVLVSAARTVGAWQPHAGAWILHMNQPESAFRVAPKSDMGCAVVDPAGRWVATVLHNGAEIEIWDAADARLIRRLAAKCPAFSPDGRWLAVGGPGGGLYAAGSWEAGPRFLGMPAVFSPDSRLLALMDQTHVIQLVATDSGQELARLEDPNMEVPSGLCFTPDGTRLITATNGKAGGVHVWDISALRTRLREIELDWDAPGSPPAPTAARPLRLQILGAEGFDLATRAYEDLVQDREESAAADLEQALKLLPQLDWACNVLARLLVLGPKALRNPEKAVSLAERAVQLSPNDVTYKNTLGVAYYRAGRWREARDTLEASIRDSLGWRVADDLFFLAMCHHQLGDAAKARECYDRAASWVEKQRNFLSADWALELREYQAEAAALLALPEKSKP
jgi:serine/threonine protein kinase/WD40 repeat protein